MSLKMARYNESVLRAMPLLALLALLSSGKLKRGLRHFAKAVIRRRKREQEISVNPVEFKEPRTEGLRSLEEGVFRPGEYPPMFSPDMESRLDAWIFQNPSDVPRWWLKSFLTQQMKK